MSQARRRRATLRAPGRAQHGTRPRSWSGTLPESCRERAHNAALRDWRGAIARTQLDNDLDRQAGNESTSQRVIARQPDLDRYALYDLGEVPGGVVRRQKAEHGAARRGKAVDDAADLNVGIAIHRHIRQLPDAQAGELRFLEISHDPDALDRDHRHQRSARSEVFAGLNALVADHARDRCADDRSEEHTSELKSLMRISYAVFCLKKQ